MSAWLDLSAWLNLAAWLDLTAGARLQPLVFALLHTLWIALLAASLLAAILRYLPASRAPLRYAAAMLTQLLIVVAALVTWACLDLAAVQSPMAAATIKTEQAGTPPSSRLTERVPGVIQPVTHNVFNESGESVEAVAGLSSGPTPDHAAWTRYVAALWLAGVVLMLVRMALAVADAGRFVRYGRPADSSTVNLVDGLRQELGVKRRVRVVISQFCNSPAVAGVFWPALVLPVSLMTALSPQAIRAILLHELAHIRRHDYLMNLVQMLIEAVLFFNPAVWWISRQIRIEREACCDSLAVQTTGEPVVYSQALADWAERQQLAGDSGQVPTAAMAFNGRGYRTLLDRIRRVLLPGERPRVHVSPISLLGLLLLALLAAGLLWQGTHVAVTVAAQILSPAERIERVAESVKANAPPERNEGDAPVTLIGTIRTEDGRPLPERVHAYSYTMSGDNSAMSAQGEFGETFKTNVSPGVIWLRLNADGYGPAVVGPFNGRSGEVIHDLEIILPIGFPIEYEVTDEDDNSISDASVSAGYITGGGSSNALQSVSDERGRGVLPHAIEGEYFISAKASGFQNTGSDRVHIVRGQPLRIVLKPALLVSGQVVTADGRPIAGATLQEFVTRGGNGGNHIHGPIGDRLATTDEEGRFILDQLVSGRIYDVLVKHPQHGDRVHEGIRPGQSDLRINLGPNFTLDGTLLGDLSSLPQQRGEPYINIRQAVPLGPEGIRGWYSDQATVEPTDNGGRFVISGLLPGEITITAGEHVVTLDLSEPRQQLTIDLTKPVPTHETRQVELIFAAGEGAPPRGSVEVVTTSLEERIFQNKKVVPLHEGRASFDVTVGVEASVSPRGLIGYWFKDNSFSVEPGKEPKRVQIETIAAGAVSGQALLPSGTPANDVSIGFRAIEKPESLRMESITPNVGQRVDADGRFVMTPLPLSATYVITAGDGHNRIVSDPIRLTAAAPTAEVTLQFSPDASASGTVLGPDGQPLADVPLQLILKHPDAGTTWSPGFVSDHNGRFQVDGLSSTLDGYEVQLNLNKDYQPKAVPLNPGGPPVKMKLTAGHVLQGRVVDAATGRPIPGVELYAYPTQHRPGETYGYEAEGKTSTDGSFRFSNLAAQPYQINDRNGLEWNKDSLKNIVPDPAKAITIEATLPEWSRLKVAE